MKLYKINLLKYISSLFLVCLCLSTMIGCSVHKAASNNGVSVADIKRCTNKGSLLSAGMSLVNTETTPDGKVLQTYRAQERKTGLNYVRAAGHGALDVMTLGLWEVVGTPVEGAISENRKYVVAKVTFPDQYTDKIESMTLYTPRGNVIKKDF